MDAGTTTRYRRTSGDLYSISNSHHSPNQIFASTFAYSFKILTVLFDVNCEPKPPHHHNPSASGLTCCARNERLRCDAPGLSWWERDEQALSNLDFKDTDSTAGIETSTVQTTDLRDWVKLDGTECDKVLSCV